MNKNESKYFNTARKMDDALISLLETKDFEYITIKDICLKAGVNRSTFYLHYSNTCDVLEEVLSLVSSSFCLHLDKNEKRDILNGGNLESLYLIKDEYLLPYLEFIKENRRVYKAIKAKPDLFGSDKTYEEMFNNIFSPIMDRFGLDEKYHKYMMDFYMHGLSSMILDWVDDDCKLSIEEISHLIKGLVVDYDRKNN